MKIFVLAIIVLFSDCNNSQDKNRRLIEAFIDYYIVNQPTEISSEIERYIDLPLDDNYDKNIRFLNELRPDLSSRIEKGEYQILKRSETSEDHFREGDVDFESDSVYPEHHVYFLIQNDTAKMFFIVHKGKILSFSCNFMISETDRCSPFYFNENYNRD